LAQVDLGTRQNRHQPLRDLSAMAYEVLVAAESRFLGPEFAATQACASIILPPLHGDGDVETRRVTLDERPALATRRG
jgi:glucosyl-3-phosphoglycerate synthase